MELLQAFLTLLEAGMHFIGDHLDFNFDDIFLRVLDMSKIGTLVIFAILLLRLALKRTPKLCSYVLWIVVLFRLLCPVGLEVSWGMVSGTEAGESYTLANDDISFTGAAVAAYRALGDAANGGLGIQHIRTTDRETVTSYWWEVWILFGKYVWVAGLLVLVSYSVISYIKLLGKLRLSMPLANGTWANDVVKECPKVFLADEIASAFVVGIFRPKIYLPSNLSEKELEYILLHEQHHIRRGDHLWKLLGFAALCIHWFNPFVWLAFFLSSKDMEMSCDEAVLRKLGTEIRKEYSASLLRLATGKRILGTPLAFGEGDTGDRIKHVMKYKKPALWLTVCALFLAMIGVVALSTNKASENTELLSSVYQARSIVYSSDGIGGDLESGPWYCVTGDYQLYRKNQWEEEWTNLGVLETYDLTNDELKEYATSDKGWITSYRIREVTDAYILSVQNDMFYLLFQTKNGHTFLGYGWEDVGERHQGASDDTSLALLYRLEATAETDQLFDMTLSNVLETSVKCFAVHREQNYWIVGFLADEENEDLGYAVFLDVNGTYKLLSCRFYENAARAQNGVYLCEDPAVLAEDNTTTNENTYDVILNINADLDRAERVVTTDGKVHHTVAKMELNGAGILVFNWAEQEAPVPNAVTQHFYDRWGAEIEVGLLTQEDIMLSLFQEAYPEVEPVDWVLADDGAQGLTGVVLYADENGQAEFIFVTENACAHVGIGAQLLPESQLEYLGDAVVSVVVQNDDGTHSKSCMSFSQSEAERWTHFTYWSEAVEE